MTYEKLLLLNPRIGRVSMPSYILTVLAHGDSFVRLCFDFLTNAIHLAPNASLFSFLPRRELRPYTQTSTSATVPMGNPSRRPHDRVTSEQLGVRL